MADRKNITQPIDWWAAWEQAAKAAGLDLAAWIGEQCNKALPKKVREKLSERATRGRPRKPGDGRKSNRVKNT